MAMLGHVLPAFVHLRTVSAEALTGEVVEKLAEHKPRVTCVGAIVPGGWKEMRHLLKRVHTAFPGMPVVVARWGLQNQKKELDLARATEVQAVSTTLKSARNCIVQLLQLAPEPAVAVDFRAEGSVVASGALN
jgi:hypothetical protein